MKDSLDMLHERSELSPDAQFEECIISISTYSDFRISSFPSPSALRPRNGNNESSASENRIGLTGKIDIRTTFTEKNRIILDCELSKLRRDLNPQLPQRIHPRGVAGFLSSTRLIGRLPDLNESDQPRWSDEFKNHQPAQVDRKAEFKTALRPKSFRNWHSKNFFCDLFLFSPKTIPR
jgi:hypothetical protein